MTDGSNHDRCKSEFERCVRERMLQDLRSRIKSDKNITYRDIASSAGVSIGWVGEVLRGNYPWRTACQLPKNIADSISRMGFKIPQEISTFDGGQGRSEPIIEEWILKNLETLQVLPHPYSSRAKKGYTLYDYMIWMLEHAGSSKRSTAFENAKSLVEEFSATADGDQDDG